MSLLKNWTIEEKYKPYNQWSKDYIEQLRNAVQSSKWRQNFHVQPEMGLLNDPNGFTYHDGKWIIFYQAFPYGTVHGLKSWYQCESEDLIHWQSKGAAILPDTIYDSHGAYSGSALSINNCMYIFYTGNVRDKNWQRFSYQLGALNQNGHISKLDEPLIKAIPSGYTAHFRDPQVFKHNHLYYMIIGVQSEEKQGKILIYKSEDLKKWDFSGPLLFSDKPMGYMVECPHLVNLKKQPVLIFCPQGLDNKILSYDNINPNTYLIGSEVNLEQGYFESVDQLKNLDDGFDAYATQAIDAEDGRTLAVSWLGVSETNYPVCDDGWTNCLSLVKELTVVENKLYQYPVKEIEKYKTLFGEKNCFINGCQAIYQPDRNSYELGLTIFKNQKLKLYLLSNKQKSRFLSIEVDTILGQVSVDRSNVGIDSITENKSTRQSYVSGNEAIEMNIFVDTSSVEIFINKGEKVISLLAFPEKEDTTIFVETEDGQIHSKLFMIK